MHIEWTNLNYGDVIHYQEDEQDEPIKLMVLELYDGSFLAMEEDGQLMQYSGSSGCVIDLIKNVPEVNHLLDQLKEHLNNAHFC